MDNKSLINIVIAVAALVLGFIMGSLWSENKMLKSGLTPSTGTTLGTDTTLPPADLSQMPEITQDDHVRGSRDAEIMLVEYSDYECPYCSLFHPTMTEIMEEYGDKVAWVYRHYPLSFHPLAQPTAEAAECVAQLGGNDAFWSFTDSVFGATLPLVNSNQNPATALSEDSILAYAGSAGVSQSAFQDCVDAGETTGLVTEDSTGGSAAGITGTPGTILMTKDGQYELISGALPVEQVKAIIEKYL